MDLQYAPPAGSPNRAVLVVLSGLATTALALAAAYLLDAYGKTNAMGWYLGRIVPAGAILVGLVAASGYGIASLRTGVRIHRALLATILLLQLAAYFGARYAEFVSLGPLVDRATGQPVGFVEYFHVTASGARWKEDRGRGAGELVAPTGYGIVVLEILGFLAGGLAGPVVLMKAPYCDLCQVYMRDKLLCVIPASEWAKSIDRSDPARLAAYRAEQEGALADGMATLRRLDELATSGDADRFAREVGRLRQSSNRADDLPVRIALSLVHCPNCRGGYLAPALREGEGQSVRTTPVERTELRPDFVRSVETLPSHG